MITSINNATVLDLTGTGATLVPDQQVVIEDGRIRSGENGVHSIEHAT